MARLPRCQQTDDQLKLSKVDGSLQIWLKIAKGLNHVKVAELTERGMVAHMWERRVREGSRDRGARPCANSRAVMPKDQMSALESYWIPEMSSGAIQHG